MFKYSGDLKSGQVLISNGQKEVCLQIVWIFDMIVNPETQPFKTYTNVHHFFKNCSKFGLKCPDFDLVSKLGTLATARPFEI